MLFNFQNKKKCMSISFNLLPNRTKKWAVKLSSEIENYLKEKGYNKSIKNPTFTIIIGGDGSFYYNLEKVKGKLILIGSETTYRSQLDNKNWKSKLIELIQSKKSIKLPLISVYKDGKLLGEGVNDVVFHSKDFRISEFEIKINNKKMKYEGDGLIISTPFGSSAYSYSAGGSKLSLNSKNFILTPICPYLRKVKPTKYLNSQKLKVYCSENNLLIIDGMIKSKKCEGSYEVVKSKNSIFYAL
jgi:NAD kinase